MSETASPSRKICPRLNITPSICLPMYSPGQVPGISALSVPCALPAYRFDPLRAPAAGLERIGKVLGFSRNLVAAELHDAHGVGRLPVIGQNVLRDPKITAADDSPHSEAL